MGRIGVYARSCLVIALVVTGVTGLGQAPAMAEPAPGSVSATFSDLCGFVRAEFTNTDPFVAAQIRYSRDGKPLDFGGGFVAGGGSATLYQVAAAGDVVRFEWDVAGGGTEFVAHEHATPAGCDEPDLSVSLIDDCGLEFTIAIRNTGTAPADVLLTAPTLVLAPVTVPVGLVEVTVPGAAGSSAHVDRLGPGGTDPFTGTVPVDSAGRAPDCGMPWPDEPTAIATPDCDRVTIVFFAVHMKGLLTVYRNGTGVLDTPVSGDIHKWTIPVTRGDVVTVHEPPLASYTHTPPAGCPAAPAPPAPPAAAPGQAPGAVPPPAVAAPPGIRTIPAVPAPPPAADTSTGPGAGGQPPARPATGAGPGAALTPKPGRGLGLTLAGIGVAVPVGLAGTLFLFLWLRRRRQPVWAVAASHIRVLPASVNDTGRTPSMSVRWVPFLDPGTQHLREAGLP